MLLRWRLPPKLPGVSLAMGRSGLPILFNEGFDVAESAPVASPVAAVPGPGNITYVQVDGQFSKSGGDLVVPTQSTPAWGDLGYYSNDLGRVPGRTLFAHVRFSTENQAFIVFGRTAGVSYGSYLNTNSGIFIISGQVQSIDDQASVILPVQFALSVNKDYYLWIVQRSGGGCYIFLQNVTDAGPIKLIWDSKRENQAVQRASMSNYQSVGLIRAAKVVDFPYPFNSATALAPIYVTSFNQTFSAELLTNGDLATWSGDNPTGYGVTEVPPDPEVTERAPANGHPDAVGAGGAANLYSSATGARPILQQTITGFGDKLYQYVWNATKVNSGQLLISDNAETTTGFGTPSFTGIGRGLIRSGVTATAVRWRGNVPPVDVTIDDLSVKQITPNTQQVAGGADGTYEARFTQPGSPVLYEEFAMCFRMANVADEWKDCWAATARWNVTTGQWDTFLYSIQAGIKTTRTSAASIGTSIGGIKVIAEGALLNLFTLAGNTWTARGVQVNNSLFQSNTRMNVIYVDTFTPLSMSWQPIISPVFNQLLQVV